MNYSTRSSFSLSRRRIDRVLYSSYLLQMSRFRESFYLFVIDLNFSIFNCVYIWYAANRRQRYGARRARIASWETWYDDISQPFVNHNPWSSLSAHESFIARIHDWLPFYASVPFTSGSLSISFYSPPSPLSFFACDTM